MAESIEDSSSSTDETLMDEDEVNKFSAILDQFTPAIPETVTQYYLKQSGVQTDDERVVKLISASVQKFMSDIINDCFQLNKLREKSSNRPTVAGAAAPTGDAATSDPSTNGAPGKKPVVTTSNTLALNDLTHVLDEYGINVKKTFYYT